LDGLGSVELALDLKQAPAPERRYLTDVFAVTPSPAGCKLLFGQEKINSSELRSLLVIHVAWKTAEQFVASTDKMGAPNLQELIRLAHTEIELPAEITKEPDQTVALRANVMGVAVALGEAAIDFYDISAFSMHRANAGGKVQLNPVVRVEVRSGQLAGLVEAVRQLVKTKGVGQ